MNSRKLTLEDGLYALALILALGVRLLNLGVAPLANLEADAALQAWDVARGALPMAASHPLYISLTSLSFALLGSSNFVARLWPALVGSALVLLPLALREKLGRVGALALAFGLALDPGLVALARIINAPMLAVTFTVLTLAYIRKPAWSGIFAGLALLSGPGVWIGWLGLGIAWGVAHLTGLFRGAESVFLPGSPSQESDSTPPLRTGLVFAAATVLLIGTRFFTFPAGLGALATSLVEFLRGWASPSVIPALRVLASLGVYQYLVLIFAGVALFWPRGRNRWVTGLSIWALTATLLALVYPGRSMGDLVWVLLPLWGIAARALGAIFQEDFRQPIATGQALAWFVLLVLAWMTLSGLRLTLPEGYLLRWLILFGIVLLGALSTTFVGLGWSWSLARNGTLLGLLAALGVYSIAVLMGATQIRPNNPAELWALPPLTGDADLLLDTLHDLALTDQGLFDQMEIISLVDQAAMRWILRDFSDVSYTTALAEAEFPLVVIAPQESEYAAWATAYRGQDFVWSRSPGWEGALPHAWVDWLIFRSAPVENETLILWARGDIFPDQAQSEETSQ